MNNHYYGVSESMHLGLIPRRPTTVCDVLLVVGNRVIVRIAAHDQCLTTMVYQRDS
jgi:hypothetical protein